MDFNCWARDQGYQVLGSLKHIKLVQIFACLWNNNASLTIQTLNPDHEFYYNLTRWCLDGRSPEAYGSRRLSVLFCSALFSVTARN